MGWTEDTVLEYLKLLSRLVTTITGAHSEDNINVDFKTILSSLAEEFSSTYSRFKSQKK